jgi:hypothetical protein
MSSQLQVSGEAKIRDIQGPVVANSGVITALDGAASQYVRGDGTLADFPTSTGGGSSVSYYLNSSVSQGTIGGVAYRELSKEPIIGAGTDIAISANGYVASYLTDANDPDVLSIPGGNFNCEFYFSVNNNTGNPFFYAELYKYDGTTFTLLGSSVGVPEYINQGTIIAPYYFAIPVATAALALTDRLAIRIYVNVDGRTVTLHTENGHLCQVVTTLSKGMVSLNNLTDQSQFLTTGTSGTNFNIVSSGDTHTFNLPVASATNTGKLSSTDWSTFNNKVPYTGATADVDLGAYELSSKYLNANGTSGLGGVLNIKQDATYLAKGNGYSSIASSSVLFDFFGYTGVSTYKNFALRFDSLTNNTQRTFTLPDLSGTLALLEGSQTFSGSKTFANNVKIDNGVDGNYIGFKQYGSGSTATTGFTTLYSISTNGFGIGFGTTKAIQFDSASITTFRTYIFPDANGTLALTSDLSAYVTLATTQTISGAKTFSLDILVNGLTVGRGGGSISTNTVLGTTALSSNTTGASNVAIGINSLNTNTTGGSNVAVGQSSLQTNNGNQNTAIGNQALQFNTTGSQNTALGHISLQNNTTGSSNTGIGAGSLYQNTTGYENTAVGYATLYSNTIGYDNVGVGYASLNLNTTGTYNTSIGSRSLFSNTTGNNNTAIGNISLNLNTTGSNNIAIGGNALANNTTSSNNTAVGYVSLGQNITGTQNSALGANSLTLNTIGSNNIAIGYTSLNANTTGSQNTSIGVAALTLHTTGTYNTAIGYGAGGSITTGSNNTIVGYYAGTATMSNNIVLADGAGNVRYQFDGTNNIFTSNLNGTSASFASSGGSDTFAINHSSGSGIALNITKGGNGEGLYINKTSGSGNAATIIGTLNATTLVKSGGTSSQYLMADGSTSTLTNPVTGTGTTNYLPKFTGASTIGNSVIQESSGNIGIGVTPTYKLDVRGSSGAYWNGSTYTGGTPLAISITNTEVGGYDPVLIFQQTDSGGTSKNAGGIGIVGRSSWTSGNNSTQISDMYFLVRNDNGGISERMRLTSTGNLGLGVTPSAWVSSVRAIQIGALGGTVITANTSAGGTSTFGQNWYFDNAFRYAATGTSSYYSQGSGAHIWYQAPSGTAGNAISFTQAMTLNASGNLMMGTTTASTGFSRISLVGGEASGTGANTGIQLTYNASTFGGGAITTINAAGGGLSFYTFAGNVGAESYSQAMTLFSTGNLLVQTGGTRTDAGYKLDVNGTGRFSGDLTIGGGANTQSSLSLTRLKGYSNYFDASNRYGDYGKLIFNADNSWTSAARRWLITNALNNTTFAIIRSVDAGTDPSLGNAGAVDSGTVDFQISNTGAATFSSTIAATSFSATDIESGVYANYFGPYSGGSSSILNFLYGSSGSVTWNNGGVKMTLSSSGTLGITTLAGTGSRAVLADSSGNLSAPVSDISVKENIKPIGYGLNEILKMNPVWFDFIDEYKNYGEGRQNGNIAQEMETIIPEAVFTTPSTGKMGINYDQMHAVYIKAIQELEARIKQLENK